MVTREKELVVTRMEDQLTYDSTEKIVTVAYPWTENVYKLTDNLQQATRMQCRTETSEGFWTDGSIQ